MWNSLIDLHNDIRRSPRVVFSMKYLKGVDMFFFLISYSFFPLYLRCVCGAVDTATSLNLKRSLARSRTNVLISGGRLWPDFWSITSARVLWHWEFTSGCWPSMQTCMHPAPALPPPCRFKLILERRLVQLWSSAFLLQY